MAVWDRFFGSSVSTAVGFGMGSALSPALSPITQAVANEVWARYPDRPLPATIAANLVAQGKMERNTGAGEALKQGFNGTQFDRMVTAQRNAPELVLLMEMWRRKFIDKAAVTDALERHGLEARWLEPLENLKTILAPPSDVIRWAVREAFNPPLASSLGYDQEFPDDFAVYAAQLGIPLEDAQRHWIAHWELPSYEQAAEMLHRRIIGGDLFDDLLKAKDYPPPWRARLRELAQRIPPISDLIRFSVREVYQDATAAKYGYDADYPDEFTRDAALHGMDASRAKQYWRAHWRLPSVRQGYVMRWRNLIGDGELDDLLRIQDYPSYWRKRLMDSRFLVPGRIDLRRLFIAGKITRAELKEGYERIGYAPDDAELLTELAAALKVGETGTRDLTLSHWTDEYLGDFITEAQYRTRLGGLGYDDAERDQLVQLNDARKVKQARDQTIARIRLSYVGHKISRAEADAALQKTAVRPAARTRILVEWDAQRAANVTRLTAAQVRAAYVRAAFTVDQAREALIDRGYLAEDADVFLGLAAPRLTTAQILGALRHRGIDEATALAQLQSLGYTTEQAHLILTTDDPELTSKQIVDAVDAGTITRDEGIGRLLGLGYRQADADVLLPVPPPETEPEPVP